MGDERIYFNYLVDRMEKAILVCTDQEVRTLFNQIKDARKVVEEKFPKKGEVVDNSENITQAELVDAVVNCVKKIEADKGEVQMIDIGNHVEIKKVRKGL